MPNHFHFLAYSKENISPDAFSDDLKIMLRSYTRAINKQEGRAGSLFSQNTKIKPLKYGGNNTHGMTSSHAMSSNNIDIYPSVCFHYIHQNPMKSKLAVKMEDWEMSSFRDYAGLRNGVLCNQKLVHELLDISSESGKFYEEAYKVIID
jgi:hypothetical protein